MEKNNNKKWAISFLVALIAALILIALFVVIIDPFFHYHGPTGNIQYTLYNERYQNDGIVKHFDYDALIIGTSMAENFKPSELSSLFDVNAIKTCFAGGSAKEINDLLKVACEYNSDLKLIVRCIDFNRLLDDKDACDYEADSYPTYLYDSNIFNDVRYIYNIEVILQALQDLVGIDTGGRIKTDFDAYGSWAEYYPCGKEYVNNYYHRDLLTYYGSQKEFTDEDKARLKANLEQNFIPIARDNPDVQFYYYYSLYNIYNFDYFYSCGDLEKYMQAEKYMTEMLLEYDNIHLYSFFDNHELMWDLEKFRDVAHYSEEVNSEILVWLKNDIGLITKENYLEKWQAEYDYFMNLDYDAMYEELSGKTGVVLYK